MCPKQQASGALHWAGPPRHGGGGQLWARPGSQALAKSGQGGKKLGELISFICKDDYFFFCPQITQLLLGNSNYIYSSFNVFKVEIWGKLFFP